MFSQHHVHTGNSRPSGVVKVPLHLDRKPQRAHVFSGSIWSSVRESVGRARSATMAALCFFRGICTTTGTIVGMFFVRAEASSLFRQHFLYFLPEPQGHRAFLPTVLTEEASLPSLSPESHVHHQEWQTALFRIYLLSGPIYGTVLGTLLSVPRH